MTENEIIEVRIHSCYSSCLRWIIGLWILRLCPRSLALMGSSKPKYLGVKYTKADYDSFSKKTNGDIIPVTTPVDSVHSIVYQGRLDVFFQAIFSNGQMHFDGTIPAKMMVEVNQ